MFKILLLVTTITITTTVFAAEDPDFKKPMQLSGDFLKLNLNNSSGYYKGNFTASQGSLKISGDQINIQQDKNNQLVSISAFGKPLRLSKKIYKTKETISTTSNSLFYDAKNSTITLEGNAMIQSDLGQQIKSAKITYNLINSDFEALANQQQRVEILLQPNR